MAGLIQLLLAWPMELVKTRLLEEFEYLPDALFYYQINELARMQPAEAV